MPLPLIPIAIGLGGTAAGAALHHWLTTEPDAWKDSDVFNNRMREMHGLALAINDGISTCKAIMSNKAQLGAWRATRDGFGAFYKNTGTLTFDPSAETVAQAKSYASKFYWWAHEYERLCQKGAITQDKPVDPYQPAPPPTPDSAATPLDYVGLIKWGSIGIGSLFLIKTLSDLFATRRQS